MLSEQSILILGSSSFLAKAFFSRAQLENWTVWTMSRSGSTTNSEKHFQGDCFDFGFLKRVIDTVNPTVVLSFVGGVGMNEMAFSQLRRLNVKILEYLGALLDSDIRMIVLGSAAEYGSNQACDLSEDVGLLPESPYGAVKVEQTAMALGLNAAEGRKVVVARPFNLIGPGTPSHLFSDIIRHKVSLQLEHDRIEIFDPEMERDFVDVRDVAKALIQLCRSDLPGGIYNICSEKAVSARTLAQAFLTSYGGEGEICDVDIPGMSPSPIRSVVGRSKLINDAQIWKPRYDLFMSVQDQISYLKENNAYAG